MKRGFVDLFGAPGGMSAGMVMAGMRPLGTVDNFAAGLETYARNFDVPKKNIILMDASKGMVERFGETGVSPRKIDVVVGGPPCQGFSNIGRSVVSNLIKTGRRRGSRNHRFINDGRNRLYKQFVKFVEWAEPHTVIMENVPGMLSYKNGQVIREIIADLRKCGYPNIECRMLNAADHGVPQKRRRIFFVASYGKIAWPEKQRRRVTVREAIGDLPHTKCLEKNSTVRERLMEYGSGHASAYQRKVRGKRRLVHNNISGYVPPERRRIMRGMGQGKRWIDLSDKARRKIGGKSDSFVDRWRRLANNMPAHTVTAHLEHDGYTHIHPTQNRSITVREAARLQGFPDWFVFCGPRKKQYRQVGNAVPPPLARAVASALHLGKQT